MNELVFWLLINGETVRQAGAIVGATGMACALIGGLWIAYGRVWNGWTPPTPAHEVIEPEGWDDSHWLDDQPIEVSQEIPHDGGEGGS